ncbi:MULTISPECIES: LLM class flavin-dependent oxidoreductase [unclassified Mycolicibacterium]|uniref:LLM class flavin-dependent oxidoreductase n=1 Tax=unclassified Mycolicibacterium TaxID=2636767 RepID=UPI0012DBCDDF|nr:MULTISPECIES: LLM class flavin-dependent oxidoreductase [unclassified Mycolicibacterium]MUL84371.1 LLM class flavin-dependent oxidoreductase [Mycolicibacterium sp. CBMA 329]MUL88146.1 LLM class flavin-dependent oxidoreductase [Mycolicibacterium sp. CBMA 331]MUM02465.1 LLM class flavin-dependent oxidoreductase [Mycolicibacterium sp. CBMA 334]MUM26008.1 LLM class flavin-dependent oxidoreductase [Mycolicibacterium sp. CBMA 295]MUM39793.1 LLM class flavin-dependent oxidoreductase [Mycolicibacte
MSEWFLFLPQVRLDVGDIVARARVAEASGFDGIAFIDHLEAPGATHQNIWEAMTVATWVAARTERLRIGHLVLCDAFRHPAVLAKQAVTLSEASGGRFELGLGSGSWPQEFERFGLEAGDAAARVRRLGENLVRLHQYWRGDEESGRAQVPRPSHPIPLVLGGIGKRMMELVRAHADWWNIPSHQLDRLPALLPAAGSARVSLQQMVGFVGRGADREAVTERSTRLFGHLGDGLVCGDAAELTDHFAGLTAQGVERFYVWFADFAAPHTISEFAETVINA